MSHNTFLSRLELHPILSPSYYPKEFRQKSTVLYRYVTFEIYRHGLGHYPRREYRRVDALGCDDILAILIVDNVAQYPGKSSCYRCAITSGER
jgi:hypothetical protein